jgi:cytochrome P450
MTRQNRATSNVMAVTEPAVSNVDLFTDDALREPYELYRELRRLGGVVRLSADDTYALPRYDEVRAAAGNWSVFSSARGVFANEPMNEATRGITLCSDPPDHVGMRQALAAPMRPEKIRGITAQVRGEAERIVKELVGRGHFDAATELAEHLPLSIVSRMVGLGDSGRDRMLEWGGAAFDAMGPIRSPRTREAMLKVEEFVQFALTEAVPGKLDPDGWAAELYHAAERGELEPSKCPMMIIDYIGPSLDTTIFAISNAILLFAEHPEQWEILRHDPSLVPHAINEILRMESPIQWFSRYVTEDQDFAGTVVPAGSRVMLLWGSANRDERKYPDPERFDVTRKPSDHMAFGYGEHLCVGMPLARLEIRALLEALLPRVQRFDIVAMERTLNNNLRGIGTLEVQVR